MNKQLISMTAVAAMAGAALAVESKNVVGFKNMASDSFQLITPTFTQVGGGTSFTLADVKPANLVAWSPASDKILFYNGASKLFEATYLTAALAQQIIDDAELENVDAVEGWYDFDDVSAWGDDGTLRCYNSTHVDFASSGFAIESSVGIRFNGEVSPTNVTMASSSFQLVGNCSGRNLTLADVKPANLVAWSPASDKILFYNGASKLFEATYLTAALAQQIIDDAELENVDAVEGWYDFDDVSAWGDDGTLRCYNSTQVPAGAGFAIESSVGVIIPTALPNEE